MTGISRRGFMALGIGAMALASPAVAIWRRRRLARRSLPIMGTIADIVVLDGSVTVAHGAIGAAIAELRRVERLMTRFDPASDVGRINSAPINHAVQVTPETAAVITEALRWAESSDGAYDPAIGAAVQLWDVTRRDEPPVLRAIERLAGRRLHRAIEVGTLRGNPVVLRRDADAQLDLGGIAKGYGVDRAAEVLRDWRIADAVVDVGGDLYAMGVGQHGDGWKVGIQSPHSATDIARVITVSNAAIATSGTYAQFFSHKGIRYHHLLDPHAAAPRVTIVQSFTIQAESCLHADAAATTCYGMSAPAMTRTLAEGAPGSRVVGII